MVLTTHIRQPLVFNEEGFQLPVCVWSNDWVETCTPISVNIDNSFAPGRCGINFEKYN